MASKFEEFVFNWIRDSRFIPPDESVAVATFLPVEVVAEPEPKLLVSVDPGGSIEIELANGHRLRVIGAFDPDVVARLARSLGA